MRYILNENECPMANDYYYEATKTTNEIFPMIQPHTHDYYEIYLFLSGSVKLSIENTAYQVKRGDIIIVPPFTIHQLLPIKPDRKSVV